MPVNTTKRVNATVPANQSAPMSTPATTAAEAAAGSPESELNTRWAFTALDYENRAYAKPDEIMIDKKTGQVWYKRPDSTVVSHVPEVQETGISEISIAISHIQINQSTGDQKFEVKVPETAGALLGTIKYAATDAITDKGEKPQEYAITTAEGVTPLYDVGSQSSLSANTFFLKVEPRATDLDYIELLTSLYNGQNHRNERGNCSVAYTVTYANAASQSVSKSFTQDVVINEMTALRIPLAGDPDYPESELDVRVGAVSKISVKVDSIDFPVIRNVYRPDAQIDVEPYKSKMNPDKKIVITNIYLAAFVDSNSQFSTLSKGTYYAFYANVNVTDRVENTGSLTPEDQEKIDNMTVTKYAYEIPTDKLGGATTYYQVFDIEGGVDASRMNVTYTNMTDDISEIKKWFVDFITSQTARPVEIRADATQNASESSRIYVNMQ